MSSSAYLSEVQSSFEIKLEAVLTKSHWSQIKQAAIITDALKAIESLSYRVKTRRNFLSFQKTIQQDVVLYTHVGHDLAVPSIVL